MCKKCGGAGFVYIETDRIVSNAVRYNRINGEITGAFVRCDDDSHAGEILARMSSEGGLSVEDSQLRLNNLHEYFNEKLVSLAWFQQPVPQSNKRMLRVASKIAEDPLLVGMAYFFGPNGNGKSTTAKAILNEIILARRADWLPAKYFILSDLLDWLRESFSKGEGLFQQRIAEIISWPVLIIDEFDFSDDKTNRTSWVDEQIHRIVLRRYDTAIYKKSFTLLLSNSPVNHLGLAAIESRLRDGKFEVVPNTAPDFRKNGDRVEYAYVTGGVS